MDSTRNQQFISNLTRVFFLLANLLPLYGVWFWNWDAKQIFLVYCLESVIVGLMTIGRMTLTGLFGSFHCAGMCGPIALATPTIGTT
ncbi:MAG: sulfite exporter TauE/SafE family protein, partial [Sediminibacterium sp.]|nr:sulfite exporter TauE/SafE family protein [Sediminibacterium sp.]